uniref:Alpha/beta hydrolase fold-3 domain-containing protein n=1 Tax=Oryza glaberrima TaxID=4538 RepID=I1NPV0_ORYGL
MDSGGGEVSEDTWGGEGRAAGGEAMEAAGSGQRRHLEVEARRAAPGSRPPCRAPRREPYGLHAARVMVSRDVHLSASSFVRLYLPPPASGDKRLPVVVYIHGGGSPSAARRRQGEQKGLWEFVCPDAADGADDPQMNPTAAGAPGLENLVCEKVMVCVAEGN